MLLLKHVLPGTIVVAKTDPPLIAIPAVCLTKWKGGRFVNWLQDVFPEVAAEAGIKWAGGAIGGVLKKLRDKSLRVSEVNVVIGERMRDLIGARGISNLAIIPNWADTTIKPVRRDENHLFEEWGLQGKFVVMYSGNMGRAHDFDTILQAASLLSQDFRIVFLFIGGGARRQCVQDEARKRKLTNVRFLPYQPRELLSSSLGVGAVHLISLSPRQEGLIVPSKLYGVIAAGKPAIFIGDVDGEIARVLTRSDAGFVVKEGEGSHLAQVILSFAENESLSEKIGNNARELFLRQYTKERACNSWEELLRLVDHGVSVREEIS